MKIKVLIPRKRVCDKMILLSLLKKGCEHYTVDERVEFTRFLIYTDNEYLRKYIYLNYYYERLIDDEKQETKNKLEKGTL